LLEYGFIHKIKLGGKIKKRNDVGCDSRCFADTTTRQMFHTPKIISFLLTLQVVLSCVEGSPAARAGIHEGDELIEINGILPSEISFSMLNMESLIIHV